MIDPFGPWCLSIFLAWCSPGLNLWYYFLTCYVSLQFWCVTLVKWVYTHVIHFVGRYFYLVQVNVGFAIGIWTGRGGSGGGVPLSISRGNIFLGRSTSLAYRQVFFPSDLNFVMTDLRSRVWNVTWYALRRRSLKHNTLIYHRRQAWSNWFWNLFPEKLVIFLVSLSFHSMSVDLLWTLDSLLVLAFFSQGLFAVLIAARTFRYFGFCGVECPESRGWFSGSGYNQYYLC